jgi:hypothetical protein
MHIPELVKQLKPQSVIDDATTCHNKEHAQAKATFEHAKSINEKVRVTLLASQFSP